MVEITRSIPVAELLSGVTLDSREGNPEALCRVTDVCVDSRNCSEGSLFVPLPGDTADGHFFIEHALKKGSALCFVNRQFFHKHKEKFFEFQKKYSALFLVVPDSLTALQDLARERMRRMANLCVIGITGSNGKTTTKEILGSILKSYDSTAINPGNLNSDIGLPMAALAVEDSHRFAIFELGINRPSEMDILVDIIRPHAAAITNIGNAHIGPLGSRRAIAEEKRKIFRFLAPEHAGYIFEKDDFVDFLQEAGEGIKTYGPASTPDYEGFQDLGLEGSIINWRGHAIAFPLIGSYNVINALCAISLALEIGVSDDAIIDGLQKVRPLFGRGMVLEGGITVIQDCYNANSDSMFQAIEFVDSLSLTGRKILILGSMKELGADTYIEHRHVGFRAADSTADIVFFFGEESAAAYDAAQENRGGAQEPEFYLLLDFCELKKVVSDTVRNGDLVLLKGSRSVELERLMDTLKKSV
ncbi:MAG: UDP-N-acetylmuramoyl-tripeptide--D-alanyl-D-alanine ligase [Spirochaetales bacterium]|nr:UDP-N-acetylmuramoyl-tripeptide--D-alanyl-D-alanine ligase [Spirochaetales bacterium]